MATTTTDGELDVSAGARAGIQRALDVLTPYRDEPRVAALVNKLTTIGDPIEAGGDEDVDDEAKLTKALCQVRAHLTKCEDLPPTTRESLRKAALALEREHLAKMGNPRAAEQWQETWGQHHGVAA